MLSVRGLTQRYGTLVALDRLDLDIPAGSFTALLGPNGAGKSTLFQVLSGLFAADEGEVSVAGCSLARQPTRALARLGVVFQQPSLDLDLTVRRNLFFHARLHGLVAADAQDRIEALARRLRLTEQLDRPARALSGGQRRKVELARALLHAPALLLMDEATVGLDPRSRQELLADLQAGVREHGLTVLWATHLVDEAAQADRVLVLHHGQLLADGPPEAVTRTLGGDTLEAAFLHATRH
ncbi:ATP-binding cassette domain-containing protein [Ideonella sp. B7]|uniref:ATP-binding cassette domain-containing protein n=1 Tax=Ideonella benzenivorans TaxID=2831643 RepID=UPI001CEDE364|nr:ATP-binding cassette domain-containing protein [Ideonella benzenivorans]MCA6217282.1 ATP-binding cassette domain-containing protein [Ideonella benzenivorans]